MTIELLTQLTQAIAAVCPIDGVADLGGGQYRIDYQGSATPEQIAAAEAIAAAWPLTVAKLTKMAELQAACKAAITGGFYSSALGDPHRYASELEDQVNIIGAKLAAIDIDYVCTDSAGIKTTRTHTAAQMSQVFFDGVARKEALTNQFHALRQQVEAATTVAAVEAIAWSEPE